MILTDTTINEIAEKITEIIGTKNCAVVSGMIGGHSIDGFSVNQTLKSDWRDGSKQLVRISPASEKLGASVSFSLGDYYYSFYTGDNTDFYFEYGSRSVKIYHTAPCGDRRYIWIKVCEN